MTAQSATPPHRRRSELGAARRQATTMLRMGSGDLLRRIDLAVLEPIEAYALRAILEYEGLRVNWFPIATTGQLRRLLSGGESPTGHLVFCCHGDERGIVLEGLAQGD